MLFLLQYIASAGKWVLHFESILCSELIIDCGI